MIVPILKRLVRTGYLLPLVVGMTRHITGMRLSLLLNVKPPDFSR
ncbi:hypothetical protein [Paramagnetospirillum marisnigri]|nr:hypothetical protein [Paramagnetospirillum marisnigri]